MTDLRFEIASSMIDDVRVVDVAGEIDMATASEITAIVEVITDGLRRVVVDLSAAVFLDSSALNALVHAQRELAKGGVDFRVVSPAEHNVRRVFELTQLTRTLGVVDSLADALSSG